MIGAAAAPPSLQHSATTPVSLFVPAVSRMTYQYIGQSLHQPRLYKVGPFTARLEPSSLAIAENPPERLQATLLTAKPSGPDAYAECSFAAQNRRPVRLQRIDAKSLMIANPFEFYHPGSGLVERLALIDHAGRLWFHGELLSQRQATERPERFSFDANAVKLHHPRLDA